INLANYNNVLIDNNTFTPVIRDAAANNDFRLITVNTKVLQSSAIPKVHNTARFLSNQFLGVAGADGTGIAFYNHDAPATMGLYVVGEPGRENVFNADITRFFYVDNSNGQTTSTLTGTYPEYSGIFNTTTAYWTQNILASQNYYDIGAGSLLQPLLMDGAQRATLANMVIDQLDDPNTAMVVLYSSTLALQPRNTTRPGEPEWGTFDIYPNPVTAGLNVQVYTRKKQPLQLRVFNMSGVCLKTLQAGSNINVRVDMAGLPAGVYAIELVTPEGSTVRQVLKR
ncbi:MAG: T9SS type A sorting domain-containing protein, partial [Niastella sp.]|nr:T9SS type A sorting domain-containing protein [Niastella sp.]